MNTLYMVIVYGEKFARIAIASSSIDDMDEIELDDKCIFVDYFNEQKIPNDCTEPAMNHTRNTLVAAGINVIWQ
jgi:hypothetical protein